MERGSCNLPSGATTETDQEVISSSRGSRLFAGSVPAGRGFMKHLRCDEDKSFEVALMLWGGFEEVNRAEYSWDCSIGAMKIR